MSLLVEFNRFQEEFAQSLWGRRVSVALCGIGALLLLHALVTAIGLFRLNSHQQRTLSVKATNVRPLPDLGKIHLFGQYVPNRLDAKDLPKSSLNYQLVGSFVANNSQHAYAVLATASGTQKLYRVGDVLPGGAKIIKILPQSVVLQHNGRLESLSLPQRSIAFATVPVGLHLKQ